MDKTNLNIAVTVNETAPCCLTLGIEVAADSVKQVYDDTLIALSQQVKLPGFRAGKVPKNMLLSRYSKELEGEATDKLINKALRQAIEEKALEFIGQPALSKDCTPALKLGEAFSFSIDIETAPKFDLPAYKGLALTKNDTDVSDEEMDKAMDAFLQSNIDYQQIGKAAAKNDMLKVSYNGVPQDGAELSEKCAYLTHADNTWLVLREPEMLPGATALLEGAMPGDEKDMVITFPADHYNTELAGKTLNYHIKINEVHTAVVPELNDDFAKKYNMESAEQLKKTYKDSMVARNEQVETDNLRKQVLDAITAMVDFAVPPTPLKNTTYDFLEQLNRTKKQEGKTEEELKDMNEELTRDANTKALSALRQQFLLSAIAKEEKVEVNFNDVYPTVMQIAQREKKPIEKTIKLLQENGGLNQIFAKAQFEKTLDQIIKLAEVTVVKPQA